MKTIIIALLFFPSLVFANSIRSSLDPASPLVNEPFRLIVEVEAGSSERPYISFNPGQAEVLGRNDLGMSTQTTIINGQISTRRIYRYAYDLIVDSPGMIRIREIKAEVGGQVITGDDLSANVARERAAPRPFFVKAEVTSEAIYIGQGINVDYYLYFRVPLVGLEIQDFPRLNNFIKRFHMTNDQQETVEVDGTLYRRRKAYSARLYPERTGEIVVDPIRLRIQYSDQPSGGLGSFGFSSRQHQTRSIVSEPIVVNVSSLPTEGMPRHFTGLVGRHDFELILPRNRFLINEVVELQLRVVGEGALENFSAPVLLNDPNLEVFDTKSDFRELDNRRARKTFDYTYIARGGLDLQNETITLAYFSPSSESYVDVVLELGELYISPAEVGSAERDDRSVGPEVQRSFTEREIRLNAPYFRSENVSLLDWNRLLGALSFVFGLLIAGIAFYLAWGTRGSGDELERFHATLNLIKKKGLSYDRLYRLFEAFAGRGGSLREVVGSISLSADARNYFYALIEIVEKENFHNAKEIVDFNFEKKYFKELEILLKGQVKNATNSLVPATR